MGPIGKRLDYIRAQNTPNLQPHTAPIWPYIIHHFYCNLLRNSSDFLNNISIRDFLKNNIFVRGPRGYSLKETLKGPIREETQDPGWQISTHWCGPRAPALQKMSLFGAPGSYVYIYININIYIYRYICIYIYRYR